MATLSLDQINRLDIVDYLASIGIHPKRTHGQHYYYLSPLRQEKTPSFKVNRNLNLWWDFGTGEGSTLVDFCIRYYDLTIKELLQKFSGSNLTPVPRHEPTKHTEPERVLFIVKTYPIRSLYLIRYLWERRIPLAVAQLYCVEVQYTFGDRAYYAIGFPCDAGGHELRNKYHKYSSSPKGPTLISHNAKDIAVFEGFFDMMTFVTIVQSPTGDLPDLLVLNSVAFFETALPLVDTYPRVHLFLDNDATGDKYSAAALLRHPRYHDHRSLYKGYKDLNEWACNIGNPILPDLSFTPSNTTQQSQNDPSASPPSTTNPTPPV